MDIVSVMSTCYRNIASSVAAIQGPLLTVMGASVVEQSLAASATYAGSASVLANRTSQFKVGCQQSQATWTAGVAKVCASKRNRPDGDAQCEDKNVTPQLGISAFAIPLVEPWNVTWTKIEKFLIDLSRCRRVQSPADEINCYCRKFALDRKTVVAFCYGKKFALDRKSKFLTF